MTIRIYAAGKVKKNGWRDQIGVATPDYDMLSNIGFEIRCENPTLAEVAKLRKLEVKIEEDMFYVGPYVISCDHGCYHGIHGCSPDPMNAEDLEELTPAQKAFSKVEQVALQAAIHQSAIVQISKCSHMFVWLDDPTAFGTLSEIGYAAGLNKQIIIGIPPEMNIDQFWFPIQFASKIITSVDAGQAWLEALNFIRENAAIKPSFYPFNNTFRSKKIENFDPLPAHLSSFFGANTQIAIHPAVGAIYGRQLKTHILPVHFTELKSCAQFVCTYHKPGTLGTYHWLTGTQ